MRNSKLVISTAVAISAALGIGAASAAPAYDWTGFYLGGNVGYSWGQSEDRSTLSNGAGTVLFTSLDSSNLDGVVGGGQAGFNWQIQNLVWGLEADIQATGQKGSRDFSCPIGVCTRGPAFLFDAGPIEGIFVSPPGPAVPVSLNQKLEWFGTARGRIGLSASPTVLLYVTGGLAYGEVRSSATIATVGGFSSTNTKAGYAVGAGIEGVISGNWTAKLEYLYIDLGRVSGSFTTTTAAFGSGNLVSTYSSQITDNIVRIGLNYKFGGLVGRY